MSNLRTEQDSQTKLVIVKSPPFLGSKIEAKILGESK